MDAVARRGGESSEIFACPACHGAALEETLGAPLKEAWQRIRTVGDQPDPAGGSGSEGHGQGR